MHDLPGGALVAVILAAAVISCCIAAAAGGMSAWFWGLLGPVGWIVAAISGVRRRIDEALDVIAPPDSRARVQSVTCRSCKFAQDLYPDPGRTAHCAACECALDGFSRSRPRRSPFAPGAPLLVLLLFTALGMLAACVSNVRNARAREPLETRIYSGSLDDFEMRMLTLHRDLEHTGMRERILRSTDARVPGAYVELEACETAPSSMRPGTLYLISARPLAADRIAVQIREGWIDPRPDVWTIVEDCAGRRIE